MIEDIKKDARIRMSKSLDTLQVGLAKIRTGRAHPSLLEHVHVDYYGSDVPISQAANVAIEDARTLAVTAWDKTMIAAIEKAIMTSDLGLNPVTAGTTIRIPLPPLTEERRVALGKVVHNEGENTKIAIRNIRRDANNNLSELLKSKDISEDDNRRAEQDIQKITDGHVKQTDEMVALKEKELNKEYAKTFLKILSPYAPHIAEELWAEIGEEGLLCRQAWPSFDKSLLVDDVKTIVVQINGKVRAKFDVKADTSKDELLSTAKDMDKVKEYTQGKTIIKEIVVPNKLINIVVK